MKITLSASIKTPSRLKWEKAVKEHVRQAFIEAARELLREAVPRIPEWAGMARGAFRNIEDISGVGRVVFSKKTVSIRPNLKARKDRRPGLQRGYTYRGQERTPELGRKYATPTAQIMDLTGFKLVKGRTAFRFRFDINIDYFDYWDRAKWGAIKAGTDAFIAKVKEKMKNCPKPTDYTTRKLIRD